MHKDLNKTKKLSKINSSCNFKAPKGRQLVRLVIGTDHGQKNRNVIQTTVHKIYTLKNTNPIKTKCFMFYVVFTMGIKKGIKATIVKRYPY